MSKPISDFMQPLYHEYHDFNRPLARNEASPERFGIILETLKDRVDNER